jgi:hypothetical protein
MAYFSLVCKPRHFLCAIPWLLPLPGKLSFAVCTNIRWHAFCDTGSFHSVLRVFIHSPRGLSQIPHWCLTSRFLAWPTVVCMLAYICECKNKWGGGTFYCTETEVARHVYMWIVSDDSNWLIASVSRVKQSKVRAVLFNPEDDCTTIFRKSVTVCQSIWCNVLKKFATSGTSIRGSQNDANKLLLNAQHFNTELGQLRYFCLYYNKSPTFRHLSNIILILTVDNWQFRLKSVINIL